ncbi:MAG: GNAT family N-acetyltransferase [Planctomycetes bacterium]|nr:GNAT family N-acetyltransferase [Planctomycetota bacterium]
MAEERRYRLPLVLGDLSLRRLRPGDAADVLAYRGDPAVARGQYWEPYTAEGVRVLLIDQGHVRPGMYGVPLILGAEYEGRVVGDFDLTVSSPEHAQGEVGFNFNRGYTGRGLATRGLAAVLGFGFVQLGLHRITAATFTDNERSWRLLERVGMRREGHFVHDGFVRGRWVDVFGYGMLADEWSSRHGGLAAAVRS